MLSSLGIKVTKSAYGNGFDSNRHNLLYCRVAAPTGRPDKFALMAASKSGKIFVYKSEDTSLTTIGAWPNPNINGEMANCQSVGINQVSVVDFDTFYQGSVWFNYAGG